MSVIFLVPVLSAKSLVGRRSVSAIGDDADGFENCEPVIFVHAIAGRRIAARFCTTIGEGLSNLGHHLDPMLMGLRSLQVQTDHIPCL